MGLGGAGAEAQADRMRSAMASPWFQTLMDNPDFLRGMVQSNPALRQLAEANPQVGAMLNDPGALRQLMAVMQNPVSGGLERARIHAQGNATVRRAAS
jgi:hypothetical protein